MKLFYTLLLAALPYAVFAQSNYHEGYVVKNNGDTLKGFIDYREWGKSPVSVDFRPEKDGTIQQFGPVTCKGFGIYGMETYISYTGLVSMNKNQYPDIEAGTDTTSAQVTIFLRQIAHGKYLTLYSQTDERKSRYFIAEANTGLVELKYYEYYNDDKQVANSPIYKGQLLYYINKFEPGNEKLIHKAEEIQYRQPDLIALIDAINGNNTVVKRKPAGRFFLGLALNSTNTQINDAIGVSGIQNSTSVLPKISMGYDVFNNPNVQRMALRGELSIWGATPRFRTPVYINNQKTNAIYEFDQYNVSLGPQILFNFYNKDNFKIYIDCGLALNFSAYANDQYTIENEPANVTEASTVKSPFKLENYWASFPLQAGIVINKKVEVCFTYTGSATFTRYSDFYASDRILSIGLKYLFQK